jgi:hypothetical protein
MMNNSSYKKWQIAKFGSANMILAQLKLHTFVNVEIAMKDMIFCNAFRESFGHNYKSFGFQFIFRI